MRRRDDFQAVVVGSGPSGLTAAIALAGAGFATALIGPRAGDDHRTTALLTSSVAALSTLGVWDLCRDHAAALRILRIVDDTARLWRAPETRFDCRSFTAPVGARSRIRSRSSEMRRGLARIASRSDCGGGVSAPAHAANGIIVSFVPQTA